MELENSNAMQNEYDNEQKLSDKHLFFLHLLYINYANTVWAITCKNMLKKIMTRQKYIACINTNGKK